MIIWLLFMALNAIYIAGLLWCVLAIRSTTKIGAEVLDIHTTQLRKQSAEIQALRESVFPRYTGGVVTLPLSDPAWEAHDAAVRAALDQAVPGPDAAAKLAQNASYGRVGMWQNQPMRDSVPECPSCGSPDRAAKPVVDTGERLEFKCDDLWHTRKTVPMLDPESAPFFTQSQPEK